MKFIGYIILFVAFYFALTRVDTYLRYKAIDDCAKVSRYETSDKNAKVSYPITDMYNTCLAEKGIKRS